MKTSYIVAFALAASLVSTPASSAASAYSGSMSPPFGVWLTLGCAGSVVLAALLANRLTNRPLTAGEASTCGISYWVKPR